MDQRIDLSDGRQVDECWLASKRVHDLWFKRARLNPHLGVGVDVSLINLVSSLLCILVRNRFPVSDGVHVYGLNGLNDLVVIVGLLGILIAVDLMRSVVGVDVPLRQVACATHIGVVEHAFDGAYFLLQWVNNSLLPSYRGAVHGLYSCSSLTLLGHWLRVVVLVVVLELAEDVVVGLVLDIQDILRPEVLALDAAVEVGVVHLLNCSERHLDVLVAYLSLLVVLTVPVVALVLPDLLVHPPECLPLFLVLFPVVLLLEQSLHGLLLLDFVSLLLGVLNRSCLLRDYPRECRIIRTAGLLADVEGHVEALDLLPVLVGVVALQHLK